MKNKLMSIYYIQWHISGRDFVQGCEILIYLSLGWRGRTGMVRAPGPWAPLSSEQCCCFPTLCCVEFSLSSLFSVWLEDNDLSVDIQCSAGSSSLFSVLNLFASCPPGCHAHSKNACISFWLARGFPLANPQPWTTSTIHFLFFW